MSSFSTLSLPSLSFLEFASISARIALTAPCSKPETWVPPFGVAITFTKERKFVSYPVPQRRAMSTSQLRVTSVETMLPFLSRTGTVSVNSASPRNRQTEVTAVSGARKLTNSEMPPSNLNSCLIPLAVLLSFKVIKSPGTKKAVWRARSSISFRSNAVSLTNICGSGQ
ncbi:unannotated protein [freshwater metagenome]|uniref:Unannotated protein n=1 Tax=freshwater metagenome TaxID=449393 RepID=A0A6J6IVC9_9ZZZZ